ncbi:glycosyltransferase family 2 protein [Sporolactobacillus terrae]|jgi:biofilm PGA synthesis N-glycosyltransferase PgaC|uniref:glycosyltransferase family 2 protein n=1 Tax=Sporolactobacillus terrae TaxID=269673 RepID=UPI001CBBA8EA|nr:glycosyltransferase [Sporolactobacillus terrae]UAK16328.1 glycosyltransferase [Sporolactobacillus terrae]
MNLLIPPLEPNRQSRKLYVPVSIKFWISHGFAFAWLLFSIYISLPWLLDFSAVVSFPLALILISAIAYIPGYLNAFLIISLFFDRQPRWKQAHPSVPVTLLIAAYNEEASIEQTLRYVSRQDYRAHLHVIVIDNHSHDDTEGAVTRAAKVLDLDVTLLHEKRPGKFHALNKGLQHVATPFVITLDADTLLHPSAVRALVARMVSSPDDVGAVAGSMLVRNSRASLCTRMQEWDYFLGIASVKRLQGLYQGTLVAQGAFSLYKTECVQAVGGWPNAIGEDIVLTWRLLHKKWRVYFEPLAVAFTDAPETLAHFAKQRSRWARGMIEGLTEIKPWQHPLVYTKYLTGINLMMPYLDIVYTVCWIPGLILAFFGIYWIVGLTTLLVLPLTILSFGSLYLYQKNRVFKRLGLRVRRNRLGLVLFLLCYQLIMSPVSVWGYAQALFRLKRVWD